MKRLAVLGAPLCLVGLLVVPSFSASSSPGMRVKYYTPAITLKAIASAKHPDQPKDPAEDDDHFWGGGGAANGTGTAVAEIDQAHTLNGLTMTARSSSVRGTLTSFSTTLPGSTSTYRRVTAFTVNHFGFADAAGQEIGIALKGRAHNKADADGILGGPLPFNLVRHEVSRPLLEDSWELPPGNGDGVQIVPPWNNTFGWTFTKPDGTKISVTGSVSRAGVSGKIDGVDYWAPFEPGPIYGELRAVLPAVYVPRQTKFDFTSTANLTIYAHKARTANMAYNHKVSVTSTDTDGGSGGGPGGGSGGGPN